VDQPVVAVHPLQTAARQPALQRAQVDLRLVAHPAVPSPLRALLGEGLVLLRVPGSVDLLVERLVVLVLSLPFDRLLCLGLGMSSLLSERRLLWKGIYTP
jgi:hypothetical protein